MPPVVTYLQDTENIAICLPPGRVIPDRGNAWATEMLTIRTAAATNPLLNRAAITNDPLRVRADGRTPQGRRIRDLYRDYSNALGKPAESAIQAAVLAAAELMVAAEAARAALLAGAGDIEQVVRLENLAARAVRRLGIRPGAAPKPPSIRDYVRGLEPAPAPAGAPSVVPASTSPPATETHHEAPHGDGEASGEDGAT
jgi:hypothetical protein